MEKYLNRVLVIRLYIIKYNKRGVCVGMGDGIRIFSQQKKGMSPLIATILLIAFAVALGTMIITWAPQLGEKKGPDCSAISMFISPYLCYAENMIKMSIRNTGAPVAGLTLRIVDDTGETIKTLPNSSLGKGRLFKREIPYIISKTAPTRVTLIPSILFNEEVVQCDKPVIDISDLPICE